MTDDMKNKVLNDVRETLKFINRGSKSLMYPSFTEHSTVYSFTTENLSSYISKLNIKNKDVLTVTASGDQMLNLVLNGAKSVDNFDINKNAYYIAQLKIAALKSLNYDEFLNFFSFCEDMDLGFMCQVGVNKNSDVMDYSVYQKIRDNLSVDSRYFWDLLYVEYRNNGKDLGDSICLTSDRKTAIFSNDYLKNESNYEKTKSLIDNVKVNFYTMDILNLYKLEKKYDCILLSNIYDYLVTDYYNVISKEEFNNYVENKLSNLLNKNGIIQLAYQYHYKTKNRVYMSSLKKLFSSKYTLDKRESLDKFCFKKILVPSFVSQYRKNNEDDCVYLYRGGKSK